ncbi:MAG: hypothetical protein ACPG5U_11005 [Planktomarina sp.]
MNAYSTDRFLDQNAFIALVTNTPETGLGWKAKLAHHGVNNAKIYIPPSPDLENLTPDLWIIDDLVSLRALRPRTQKPILASMPSHDGYAQYHAFDLGAEDCILSNASDDELSLRIGRLLRKADRNRPPMDLINQQKFDTLLLGRVSAPDTIVSVLRVQVSPQNQTWAQINARMAASMHTALWARIARLIPEGSLCCRTEDGVFRIALPQAKSAKADELATAIKTTLAVAPLCLMNFDSTPKIVPTVTVQKARKADPKPAARPVKRPSLPHLDNAPVAKGDRSVLSVLQSRAVRINALRSA